MIEYYCDVDPCFAYDLIHLQLGQCPNGCICTYSAVDCRYDSVINNDDNALIFFVLTIQIFFYSIIETIGSDRFQ